MQPFTYFCFTVALLSDARMMVLKMMNVFDETYYNHRSWQTNFQQEVFNQTLRYNWYM